MKIRSTVPFLIAALALAGCSAEVKTEGLLPQIDAPAQPQTPPPPATLPASIEAKLGSNGVPVKSFETDAQAFYFNFSKIDAEKLDYYVESKATACSADPVTTISLVDFADGSEKVVKDLGDSATLEKPASEKAFIRVSISGLKSCFGYGMTFKLEKI